MRARGHAGLIAFLVASTLGVALAAQEGVTREYRIDGQPLDRALRAFAMSSGMDLLFSPDLVAGRASSRLDGTYSVGEALALLLKGTGLRYAIDGNRVVISSQQKPTAATTAGEGSTIRLAQTSETGADEQDMPRSAGTEGDGLSEVVVTGSRVARSTFDTPTPVSVLDSAQIEQSGFNNIGDVLGQLPSIGLGLSSSTGQFSSDAGAAFVNLRGLGTGRTLVLIDGRRRVSGSSDSSAVDLSTIPASMIERVEIITGGASAVYGADAVSGVINVILKQDFRGFELSAQGGISQHGGADSLSASAFGGVPFADERGSVSFAISHNRESPMFSTQRSFADSWIATVDNPANTGPADGIPDLITLDHYTIAEVHPAGAFDVGGTLYTVDPQLRPLQVDPVTGIGVNGDGWDFSRYFQQRMRSEVTSFRTDMKYRMTERVQLFAQAEFSSGSTFSSGAPNYDAGETLIQRDNPYVPADLAALMDANGVSEVNVLRASLDQGIRSNDNDRNTYSVAMGLQGAFGQSWKWQAFGQYGRYDLESRATHQRWTSRYLEAIDVIADPLTGDPVCRSASARAAGCSPLNVLGMNVATPEALAYFSVDSTLQVENTQTLGGLQFTGTLFDLPAGPLASALGIEYRKDTRSYVDDPLAQAGLLYRRSGNTTMAGEDAVSEAFVELVAPVLSDRPMFHLLQIEGAARYSDYDSIGSTVAWKVGTTWAPVRSVKVRATRSKSVRAPNLYELYSPTNENTQLYQPVDDPCDVSQLANRPERAANCLALGIPAGWSAPSTFEITYRGGGSPQLQEETSNAWTAGIVLTPEGVPGLSLSADYWHIDIDGAVQQLDADLLSEKCVDASSVDNVFCSRVTRAADHSLSLVDYSFLNIGTLAAKGVDLQAAYGFHPEDIGIGLPGRLSLLLNASYLASLRQLIDRTDATTLLIQDGQYDNPNWRASLSLGYEREALRVHLNTRLIGKARVDVQSSMETYDRPRVPARVYNDLIVGYRYAERYDLRLGINNILDTKPPATEQTYLGMYTLYDAIGRFFTLGASVRF